MKEIELKIEEVEVMTPFRKPVKDMSPKEYKKYRHKVPWNLRKHLLNRKVNTYDFKNFYMGSCEDQILLAWDREILRMVVDQLDSEIKEIAKHE